MRTDTAGKLLIDLDGTLAKREQPFNPYSVGEPVEKLLKAALAEKAKGRKIVCFTARAASKDKKMHATVRAWLDKHGLEGVEITDQGFNLNWLWLMPDGKLRTSKRERHNLRHTPEYRTWKAMRGRCLDGTHRAFMYYGARGIQVCAKWRYSFMAFLKDMGQRPPGHSLDRIDNDGGYEPGNCRWATAAQQNRNRRNNVHVTSPEGCVMVLTDAAKMVGHSHGGAGHRLRTRGSASIFAGEWGLNRGRKPIKLLTFQKQTLTLKAWAAKTGISFAAIRKRLYKYGWSVERILTAPVDTSKHSKKRKNVYAS